MNIMRKKIVMIALACMALLMTQCKKKIVEQPCGGLTGEQIVVTLSADNGGEKTNITETGLVTWDLGDKLYVVAETSGYLGYLSAQNTGTSAYFTGSISAFSGSAQDLHFYYVGKNKTIAAGSVSYNYSIASQTLGTLDDIENNFHLMHGCIENVAAGQTSLGSVTMQNMMTILKLNFSAQSGTTLANTLKCCGGYSKMTVNLKTGGTTPTKGDITLGGTSSKSTYYMVVIPGKQVFDYLQDDNNDGVYDYKNDKGALTRHFTFEAGKIYNEKSIVIGTLSCLPGEFTVDANGTKVRFSTGNLQYLASSKTWRFARKQYQVLGTGGYTDTDNTQYQSGNGTTTGRVTQTKWIDLFGWGTSGWSGCNNTYYQPYDAVNVGNGDAAKTYGPYGTYSLVDDYENSDWGMYNSISNFKNSRPDEAGVWRALTQSEMDYILSGRTQYTNRFAKARLQSKYGIVLFPDNYNNNQTVTGVTGIATVNNNGSFPSSNIDASIWETMEQNGCIFFPVAGKRGGTSVDYASGDKYCMYWLSTCNGNGYARSFYFNASNVTGNDSRGRDRGYPVRLVH